MLSLKSNPEASAILRRCLAFAWLCMVPVGFACSSSCLAQEKENKPAVQKVEGQISEVQKVEVQDGDAFVEIADDEAIEMDDDDEVMEAQVMMNAFGIEPRMMQAAKKFQLNQVFAVEIDELTQICELDKKQVLKLKIGSKGAVKKLTAEWIKQTNGQMAGMGIIQDDEEEAKDDEALDQEELVIKDADEIDEMTLQMLSMNNFSGNPFKSDAPTDSRFWRKTVANVLTDQQQEKFKQVQLERAKFKRAALINYTVSAMTVELGLAENQVVELDAIIRPVLVDVKIDCVAMYEPYLLYYYASKADEKKLKELLTPAQLQKWKIFIGPSKQIGQMMEQDDMEMGGMVVEGVGFLSVLDDALNAIAEGIEQFFNLYSEQ